MERKINQCPEFPFFGATYPDATCIDGMLWDLDSYEDGGLTKGGEDPCPFCNKEAYTQHMRDCEFSQESIETHLQALNDRYNA